METTYSGITILEGDDITLSCRPSQSEIALQWLYNGSDISNSSQYQFTPPMLYHDLTITHANIIDSGNYVCAIKMNNTMIDQQSINLTVISSEHDFLQMYKILIIWKYIHSIDYMKVHKIIRRLLVSFFLSLFAELFW